MTDRHKVLTALLLHLALLPKIVSAAGLHEEELIGWQGETYKPKEYLDSKGATISNDREHSWIQTISWKPRAQVYHGFLSDSEARHIIQLARYQMKRSMVTGVNDTGAIDNERTSAGMFIKRNHDPIITAVDQRLAVWAHLPPEHQEDMQVLRYGPTNKYGPHIDGLGRVISVLIYLVEPKAGGETAFVDSEWSHPELAAAAGNLSKCAAGHVAYKPKRGDALLFHDVELDYITEDVHSMHTGCPVIEGVKWNAVKWIHGTPYNADDYKRGLTEKPEPTIDPGVCTNDHPDCQMWADSGECEKNSGYMLGKPDGTGTCRKACKDCDVCVEGDLECIKSNRMRGGFVSFEENEFGF